MIALVVVVAYAAGWIAAAVAGIRWLTDHTEACARGKFSYYLDCPHLGGGGWGHWSEPGVTGRREVTVGALAALAWPIAWLPAVAFYLATRKPTPAGLQRRIAELEKEAGIR